MDFSDWGSNAGRSDGTSSVLSPSGQSQSSTPGILRRIDESTHEDHPSATDGGSKSAAIRRAESSSTDNPGTGGGGGGGGGSPRGLETIVSFSEDEPVEAVSVERRGGGAGYGGGGGGGGGGGKRMSLAERAKGGSSPGVSRRCVCPALHNERPSALMSLSP